MPKSYIKLISDGWLTKEVEPKFDPTFFTGFVIDPFEFSILLKPDGSVWNRTGSIEWHKGYKDGKRVESEYWDNPDWMLRVLDGEQDALEQLPSELSEYDIANAIEVMRLAKHKGWI